MDHRESLERRAITKLPDLELFLVESMKVMGLYDLEKSAIRIQGLDENSAVLGKATCPASDLGESLIDPF
jgi:hypothetical protein